MLTLGGLLETLGWDFKKLDSLTLEQWKFVNEYQALKNEIQRGTTTRAKLIRKRMGIK